MRVPGHLGSLDVARRTSTHPSSGPLRRYAGCMALLVFLALLAAPILEIFVIIEVGGRIGALPTIGLLVLSAVVGVIVVKREGLGLLRRAQEQLRTGEDPAPEVLDRLLVIVAGILLVLPGFISDAVAVLLLVPPLRHVIGNDLSRRLRRRVDAMVTVTGVGPAAAGGRGFGFTRARVYDARVIEDLGDVTPPEWRDDDPGGSSPGRSELTP